MPCVCVLLSRLQGTDSNVISTPMRPLVIDRSLNVGVHCADVRGLLCADPRLRSHCSCCVCAHVHVYPVCVPFPASAMLLRDPALQNAIPA